MRKVRATQRIKRDGEVYEPGDVLVVPNNEAARLEAYDAIEKKEKPAETPKEDVEETEEETVDETDEDSGEVDYSAMSKAELVELGKERGVAGVSKLAKADLVEILTEQDKD